MKKISSTSVILSVLLIAVLGYFIAFQVAERRISTQIYEQLHLILGSSINAYLYGVKDSRGRDDEAIMGLIETINTKLSKLNPLSTWSPVHVENVSLLSIGEVFIKESHDEKYLMHTSKIEMIIDRGNKPRTIIFNVAISPNWVWFYIWALFVLVVVGVFSWIYPSPLGPFGKILHLHLLKYGVEDTEALAIARKPKQEIRFSEQQWGLLDQLLVNLGKDGFDLETILEAVLESEDKILSGKSQEWLNHGLKTGMGPIKALELAKSEDKIEYQVQTGELKLRGLPISMNKGPLLYYLWYLTAHTHNEGGWVSNPRSNKHDDKYGESLEDLADALFSNKIDDRTLDNIQKGVTSKMLTDMRNKIKCAIQNTIPKDLAKNVYFVDEFRKSKETLGGKDFRVGINPEYIHIIY